MLTDWLSPSGRRTLFLRFCPEWQGKRKAWKGHFNHYGLRCDLLRISYLRKVKNNRARMLSFHFLQPYMNRKCLPKELMPLPWDHEREEGTDAVSRDEARRRMERRIRKEVQWWMGSGHEFFVQTMAVAIPKRIQNKRLLTQNNEINIVDKRSFLLHTMASRSATGACLPKKEEKSPQYTNTYSWIPGLFSSLSSISSRLFICVQK